jgi:hypothetical protein
MILSTSLRIKFCNNPKHRTTKLLKSLNLSVHIYVLHMCEKVVCLITMCFDVEERKS